MQTLLLGSRICWICLHEQQDLSQSSPICLLTLYISQSSHGRFPVRTLVTQLRQVNLEPSPAITPFHPPDRRDGTSGGLRETDPS